MSSFSETNRPFRGVVRKSECAESVLVKQQEQVVLDVTRYAHTLSKLKLVPGDLI